MQIYEQINVHGLLHHNEAAELSFNKLNKDIKEFITNKAIKLHINVYNGDMHIGHYTLSEWLYNVEFNHEIDEQLIRLKENKNAYYKVYEDNYWKYELIEVLEHEDNNMKNNYEKLSDDDKEFLENEAIHLKILVSRFDSSKLDIEFIGEYNLYDWIKERDYYSGNLNHIRNNYKKGFIREKCDKGFYDIEFQI